MSHNILDATEIHDCDACSTVRSGLAGDVAGHDRFDAPCIALAHTALVLRDPGVMYDCMSLFHRVLVPFPKR